jgi:ribosomal protein L37E
VTGPGRPVTTITCARCGEQRRNARHGLCNRCSLADPDRPFRYAAVIARRLAPVPAWWDDLTAFAAARHHPGGAIVILREAGRLLAADPAASPPQLLDRCAPAGGTAGRALRGFFTSRGLALPGDEKQRRAAARRRRHLDAVPAGLAAAVAGFNRGQLEERDRARRAGRRPLSDITLETRLRILRDLAVHLTSARPVTSWSQVTTADLEGFLGHSPGNRHQRTYVLRGFFGWAKRRKLILIDPATTLQLGSQPAFTGSVLDDSAQRALFRRWTANTGHPHERLIGLLALLHAASSAQLRSLTISDADHAHRTLNLAGRPFPAPLDPVSWAALEDCLRHRAALRTLNPHMIVTSTTRTGDSPAHQSYLTRALRPAGTTPALCRQTRVSQLVTDLDPKLAAAALGMQDSGLVRYLTGNIDRDRLERTPGISRQPTRARQAPPCTP